MLILSQDIGNGNKTQSLNHTHSLAHLNGIWKNCETSPTQANSRCRWFININNKFRMWFQPPSHTHTEFLLVIFSLVRLFSPGFLSPFPLLPNCSPAPLPVWSCGPPRVVLPVSTSPSTPPRVVSLPPSEATQTHLQPFCHIQRLSFDFLFSCTEQLKRWPCH